MEILLSAALMIYLFYRLWTVLGTRSGSERTRDYSFTSEDTDSSVVVMPTRNKEDHDQENVVDAEVVDRFAPLKKIDNDFNVDQFLSGAQTAYEMIIEAFSDGQKKRLKKLLSDTVYHRFESAIDERISQNQTLTTTIHDIHDCHVDAVDIIGSIARVTVRFKSEQTIITTDENGTILDNPAKLSTVLNDIWTFEKDLSTDTNIWILVKTRSDN